MKTSDYTVAACMELMHYAFIDLRSLASLEVGNKEEESSKIRPALGNIACDYRIALNCLIIDIGDEETNRTIQNIKSISIKWQFQIEACKSKKHKLVVDEIKTKIFVSIDLALRHAEEYGHSSNNAEALKLYREMDSAHNVPHEIYE